jgi:GGDEF domain-containing protein
LLKAIGAIDLSPVIGTSEIALTASIGLASCSLEGPSAASVVESAVARMFAARKEGGNRITAELERP